MKMTNKNKGIRGGARCVATGGVISALGITLMALGSLLEVLDLSCALLASLLIIVMISEYGKLEALCVYAATSVLAWLLLPNRTPAAAYTFLLGYYPILKPSLARLKRLPRIVVKYALLNAATALSSFLIRLITMPEADAWWVTAIFFASVNFAFFFYDILVDRAARLWVLKWRRMFGFAHR